MKSSAVAWRNLRLAKLNWKYILALLAVAVIYAIAAKLGLSLARTTQQVTMVWPPSGIALAVLLVFGYRYWPGIYLGAFVANLLTHELWLVAVGIALGNTLEALAGAWLLRTVAGFKRGFVRPRDAVVFTVAAVVSTVIAALFGTACLVTGGLVEWAHYWPVMATWWRGDLMGDLIFGGLLLVYLNPRALVVAKGRLVEGGLLLATMFALSIFVFTSPLGNNGGLNIFPYLLFPVMIWAATRFTQPGVATGSLVVTLAAIWANLSGVGPFNRNTNFEANLFDAQVFVAVLSATSLILAMTIAGRMAAERALAERAEELKRMDDELKQANLRMTNILAGVLDEGPHRPPRSEKGFRE